MESRHDARPLSPRDIPHPHELAGLISRAVQEGTGLALAESGAIPAYLSKTEAYRQHGRTSVDRWIAEGLIRVENLDGRNTKKLIRRDRLEGVAAQSNRNTYLAVRER